MVKNQKFFFYRNLRQKIRLKKSMTKDFDIRPRSQGQNNIRDFNDFLIISTGPLLIYTGPLLINTSPLLNYTGPLLIYTSPLLIFTNFLLNYTNFLINSTKKWQFL